MNLSSNTDSLQTSPNSVDDYNQRGRAADYIQRGYKPVPVKFKDKKTVINEWQNLRIDKNEIDRLFPDKPNNIGIILGKASGGLVDVDLDDDDTVQFAADFLPQTESVFGTPSRRSTHRLYRVPKPGKGRKLSAIGIGAIVELRSNEQYTVFPGSIHKESGETITFEIDGEPGEAQWEELEQGVINIALAVTLSKRWKPGNRHSLALHTAGFLQKKGWSREKVEHLILVVATKAGDDDVQDRLMAVRTTFDAACLGKQVSGRAGLVDCLGEITVRDIENWLGGRASEPACAPMSPLDLATDAGCTDAFVDKHKGLLIYSGNQSQWYRRNNAIFEPVALEIVQGLVKGFLQEAAASVSPHQTISKTLLGRSRINAVLELSRSHLWANSEQFDSNTALVGCPDGSLLDLDSGQPLFDEFSVIVTKKLGTAFDPEAKCPNWMGFLETIFESNHDVTEFIQRAVGYSLSGLTSEQALFILVGNGANGKSTFLRTTMQLLGDYGTTLPMQTLMEQTFGGNQTNDLASLVGKRFVSASEGESSQKLAESKIKLITGGDRIKCRHLHKDFFEYQPQFKLWLATNNLPSVSGCDDAVWRRIKLIKFPVSIPPERQDKDLTEKLIAELPGILNWALEGYRMWREIGLCPPAQVMNATTSYRDENDIVQQWIDASCLLNPKAETAVKELYKSYCDWCDVSGLDAKADSLFGKALNRKGFELIKKNKGNHRRGLVIT